MRNCIREPWHQEGWESLFLGIRSIMPGKAWWQAHGSTVGKQRVGTVYVQLSFSFLLSPFVWDPSPQHGTAYMWGASSTINLIQIIADRQAQRYPPHPHPYSASNLITLAVKSRHCGEGKERVRKERDWEKSLIRMDRLGESMVERKKPGPKRGLRRHQRCRDSFVVGHAQNEGLLASSLGPFYSLGRLVLRH